MAQRPVRPRHAATLVLVRPGGGGTQVLMGRRPQRSSFMPGVFVFPGGAIERSDRDVIPSAGLAPDVLEQLCNHGHCTPALASALATAAIRETFEETGLILGGPADPGTGDGSWAGFRERGLAPAHDRLRYLGRAITPTESPTRFDARFFLAEGDGLHGALTGSSELEDLAWYALDEARRLPTIIVTSLVLQGLSGEESAVFAGGPFFRRRRRRRTGDI